MNTVAIDDPEAAVVQRLESDPYFSGDQAQLRLQKAFVVFARRNSVWFSI